MAFQRVTPALGRGAPGAGVSFSWKPAKPHMLRPSLHVGIAGRVALELGWKRGDRVGLEFDRVAHLARLAPHKDRRLTWSLLSKDSRAHVLLVAALDLPIDGARFAEQVTHRVERSALICHLPDWLTQGLAARDAALLAATTPEAEAPTPQTTETPAKLAEISGRLRAELALAPPGIWQDDGEELEALQMVQAGKNARDLAEYFGTSIEASAAWCTVARAALATIARDAAA